MPTTRSTAPRRRGLYPLLGLALAAAVVPAAGAGATSSKTVTLQEIAFSPKSVSVSKGTKVTFAFRDDGTTHNVKSTGSKRFTAITDRASGSPSRMFSRTGTYRFECTLHPGMTGRITVR